MTRNACLYHTFAKCYLRILGLERNQSIYFLVLSTDRPARSDSSVEIGIPSTQSLASIYHPLLKEIYLSTYLSIIYSHIHACIYNYNFPRDWLQYLIQYSYLLYKNKEKRVEKIANPLGFSMLKQSCNTQVKLGILWTWSRKLFLLAVENGILDYVRPYYNCVWKCIMGCVSIQCN